MIINVALDKIQPNPWQTRLAEPDPEYIKELAMDIAANGLLQMPVGRIIGGEGTERSDAAWKVGFENDPTIIVQLAFGHNRLAAYRFLDSEIDDKWPSMPVDIRQLTDEQMATIAWSENEKRRDVTPIERAKAIERRMTDFGWSQTQLAEQLGINRSTVSNILRLLKLPQNMQDALASGQISERVAQALLPMYELPEHTRKIANDDYWLSPKITEQKAMDGESSDSIRNHVKRIYDQFTRQLQKAEFGLDELFPEGFVGGYDGAEGGKVYCGLCRTCDRREKHEGNVCMDATCFNSKTTLHRRMYLANAAAASGYEVSDPNKGGQVTSLRPSQVEQILATRCENLRLVYAPTIDRGDTVIDKFPHAKIVCDKRNYSCSCANGLDLAAKAAAFTPASKVEEIEAEYEPLPDVDPDIERISVPVGAQTQPAAPSADELAELARQARLAKKDVSRALKELRERLIDQAVQWFVNDEPGAFYALLHGTTWIGDRDTLDDMYRAMAGKIIDYPILWDEHSYSSPEQMYEQVNNRLRSLRLPEVSRGRPLVEVWAEVEE